jgi:hypothetical protein
MGMRENLSHTVAVHPSQPTRRIDLNFEHELPVHVRYLVSSGGNNPALNAIAEMPEEIVDPSANTVQRDF